VLKPVYQRRFKKEVEKARKRGKNIEKLKNITRLLAAEQCLSEKYRNHKLRGQFNECWECHIEPDWLLIYKKTSEKIIFLRTGTHADLF